MNYCSKCGSKTQLIIPTLDNRPRDVCENCKFIHYQNPNNIVGIIASYDGKVLLCKRNTEPRKNYWTVPAGFMENGETLLEGAQREANEEVGIEPHPSNLFLVYSVPHISQVHFYFYCNLNTDYTNMGNEINDIMFCSQDEVPWDLIAFNSIKVLLKKFFEVGPKEASKSFFNFSFPEEIDDLKKK